MSRIITAGLAGFIVALTLASSTLAKVTPAEKPDETVAILARFETGVIARMERGQDNPARHTIEAVEHGCPELPRTIPNCPELPGFCSFA